MCMYVCGNESNEFINKFMNESHKERRDTAGRIRVDLCWKKILTCGNLKQE